VISVSRSFIVPGVVSVIESKDSIPGERSASYNALPIWKAVVVDEVSDDKTRASSEAQREQYDGFPQAILSVLTPTAKPFCGKQFSKESGMLKYRSNFGESLVRADVEQLKWPRPSRRLSKA
jgi:hypothetical protein